MSLLEQIRIDIQDITSNANEFGVELTLTAPNGQTATLTGLHTKHHLGFDSDSGRDVNTKNAHVSFSEQALIDVNPAYPLRDANNEVHLREHKIKAKDSTGREWTYKVLSWFPDETVGLIVCVLNDWKAV